MVPSSPPAREKEGLERIGWELDQLDKDPPHGVNIAPSPTDRCRVQITLLGPHGSPYEGGIFKLDWSYSPHHPTLPPIVRFLTRIYHPSVDDEGKLGLRVLSPGLWRREFTIRQILLDIQLLLLDPDTGGYPLVPGVRDIFNADLDQFNRVARVWTCQYAGRDQACRPAGKVEEDEEGYSGKNRALNFAGPPLPPLSSLHCLHQPPAKRRRHDAKETLALPLPPPLHPITVPDQHSSDTFYSLLPFPLRPTIIAPPSAPPDTPVPFPPLLAVQAPARPTAQGAELDFRVEAVLEELRLASRYRATFAREEVSYAAFLLLNAYDLAQMGLPIGPRKVLLDKIHQLRNNDQRTHHEPEHVVL